MQHPICGRGVKLRAIALALLVAVLGLLLGRAGGASAASAVCSAGSTMIVVAHEDDSLLFMNPDLIHAVQNGRCVRTVFVTAGDDGQGQSYWSSREQGIEAAYAEMAGVANTWTQSDAGVTGHPISLMTLSADPNISIAFMRLPDGNLDGSGFASQGYESLQKLYTGGIPQMTAVDGSSSYALGSLISTLSSLVTSFRPDTIWTQDYAGSFGDGDHSDHYTVAYLTREVSRAWTATTHTLTGYMDYTTEQEPANVTGSDLTAKEDSWFSYTPFDSMVCQTEEACQPTAYGSWLQAQYTVGTETDGPGTSYPPVASAGPNQTVGGGATVQLDGSASSDPGGNPSYKWTQTGGPSVTLSSSTAVTPTFTAPSAASTLTFQLVVTDGSQSSNPGTVTITVSPAGDVARQASATASSQNTSTGQTAAKAIDGVIDGYPGDPTKEWATIGGGAGSWLKLTWTNAQTINDVVLYDRPNLNDQVTGGTLTFSDGSTVNVPSLNNDGAATTVTFPAKTTTSLLFTVRSVSSTTSKVGLAEIEVFAPQSGGGNNAPPTADAGADQVVATGSTVQLDGSASYDPGGNPSYKWTQTSGPAVTLSNPASVKPTFTAPSTATTLTFQLVVTDGSQSSQPATVNITVKGGGSGSSGPGGNPSHQWTQTATPSHQRTQTATLSWTVIHTARSSAFKVLALNHVPAGATVTAMCKGAGCRFASRSIHVPTTQLVCGRHHRHCKRKPSPALAAVNLEPLFSGSHLAIGDRTTFKVTQANGIGEEWTLTVRPNQAPAEVGPICLAPGSHGPGKRC